MCAMTLRRPRDSSFITAADGIHKVFTVLLRIGKQIPVLYADASIDDARLLRVAINRHTRTGLEACSQTVMIEPRSKFIS